MCFNTTHEGYVTVDTFFDKMIQEPQSTIGLAIFTLIDAEDPQRIEFGEFVQVKQLFLQAMAAVSSSRSAVCHVWRTLVPQGALCVLWTALTATHSVCSTCSRDVDTM